MKKAVFFDIDGTLWDAKMQIPQSTIEGIRKLRANGHLAFICTGRSRATVCTPALLEIGFDGIVAGCGTHIEKDGQILFEKLMSQKELEDILHIVKECGMRSILEGREYLYINSEEFAGDSYIEYLRRLVGERYRELEEKTIFTNVNKLSADVTGGDCDKLTNALKENYELIYHAEKVVEILPKNYSKATGIQKVCELLNIRHEDTYAFGDSANDLEMIRYVSHGVAMENAEDMIKEQAEYVTDMVKEDGIYNGLLHYGLI